MPTEPIRMYFHEASTDAFVTCSGMSMADVIVVASMAIHMKPTLFEVTANSIVKREQVAEDAEAPGLGAVVAVVAAHPRPEPGGQRAHHAHAQREQASRARRPAGTPAGPEVSTSPARMWRHSATAAPRETRDSRAFVQPTKRR